MSRKCRRQLLPINQNQALLSLLGTTYGGDGRATFALPDLRARVPIHMGASHTLGERGGEQAHTLSISETPTHLHAVAASASATGGVSSGANNYLGGGTNVYAAPNAGTQTTLRPDALVNVGGSQAHQNSQPFLTLSFCIALQGIFPSQT